ncbi:MAG: chitobiase/beta-hexosaminidase C-terminal domain-containing protein [Bacteroidaceae bacterium]|nr:chitobiase/beta-hexosaminidase C-terminal domain-containing protein [Bacteroidaceae bacterium]
MSIKINARETNLKIGKVPGYYYVMTPKLYIALTKEKVIKEAALRSGVSKGVMQACWDAAGEVIKAWATEGHSVAIPGLGTMRFTVRSKAVANVNDVKTGLIKCRRIVFTPSTDLKEELANTAIQITCYNRNGEIVKRVTSDDGGNVEDDENQNENENQGGNQNGNENDNENQNQNEGSLASPVISGLTPFEETTEVTITGPDGAEIRYTTDGSTPTSESTLYSEAVTLSDTATVKVIAIKDGQTSEVASKLFTKGNGDPIED